MRDTSHFQAEGLTTIVKLSGTSLLGGERTTLSLEERTSKVQGLTKQRVFFCFLLSLEALACANGHGRLQKVNRVTKYRGASGSHESIHATMTSSGSALLSSVRAAWFPSATLEALATERRGSFSLRMCRKTFDCSSSWLCS